MEKDSINKALNKRLLDLSNGLSTVFDNDLLIDARSPYQRVSLHPIVIEGHRDMGLYVVTLSYPGECYDSTEMKMMAQKIKDHFYRGLIFIEGDEKLIIERHPESSPPYKNNKRLDMTIRIRYYCF